MNQRKHNFNPGPSVLPLELLEKAHNDLINYQGCGIGILEMSHRTPIFESLVADIENNLRELMEISDNYKIALCTGGATNQFSMVPLNLLGNGTGNYHITGFWSDKAYAEAKKYGKTHICASSKEENYRYIPKSVNLSTDASYLHFTSNNTIVGTQFFDEPDSSGIPLVCDASSDILAKKINVNKYGIIYAGAQKNIGTAGVTLVIIHKDLLSRSNDKLPILMDYRTYVNNQSLYNTPPIFPYYVMGEMLKWMKAKGGVSFFENRSKNIAKKIYNLLDNNNQYITTADKADRSRINIAFRFKEESSDKKFLQEAERRNLYGLKGHKLFGGIRISLYNAIPDESVDAICQLLSEFKEK